MGLPCEMIRLRIDGHKSRRRASCNYTLDASKHFSDKGGSLDLADDEAFEGSWVRRKAA